MGICILLLKIKCVWLSMYTLGASQVAQEVKNPPASAGDIKRLGFDPWVGKISWRRKWQLTPVFLPGESHGQRSLAGYSSWGRRELDMTEVTERANIYIQIQFISIAIQNYIIEINYNLFSFFFYNLFSMLLSKSIWILSNNDAANLHIPVLFCTFGRIYQGH